MRHPAIEDDNAFDALLQLDKRAEKENPTGNVDNIQWDSPGANPQDPNAPGVDPQSGAS